MSNKYLAYEIQAGAVEATDSQGRVTSQKARLIPIPTKAALKKLVKDSPQLIFLDPLPNPYADKLPYKGFLLNAPQDQNYIIEGRKEAAPAKNSLGMMMQMEFGREVKTYDATLSFSERAKGWRVTM